jgi:hypothetical protein
MSHDAGHKPHPLSEKPFVKVIQAGDVSIEVYGGLLYRIDNDNQRKPPQAEDPINVADIVLDVTRLLSEEGLRRGTPRAEELLRHVVEAFREAGYSAKTSFNDEGGKQTYYLTVRYPAKMERHVMLDQMIEAVDAGIATHEQSHAGKAGSGASKASKLFDGFSATLREELGEDGAAKLEAEHPKLLGKLVQAAIKVDTPAKTNRG